MNKKRTIFTITTLSLSLVFGVSSGYYFSKDAHANHSVASSTEAKSLEEEISSTDLVIKGTVVEELGTFKQDAGVVTEYGSFDFDVTTYKVKVDTVLNGEIDSDSDSIVLYQHGSSNIPNDAKHHVNVNEEVYLLLTERPDGKGYWSYNFDDGIWKIENKSTRTLVQSDTESSNLTPLDGKSIQEFEEVLENVFSE